MLNLHEESIYLQGARAVLLRLEQGGGVIHFDHPIKKDSIIYNKAVFKEILENRESLIKFLQGNGWRYYDHQRDNKNRLVSVKVEFNKD